MTNPNNPNNNPISNKNVFLDYFLYFTTFITSQSLSMWGQYFTLKFKNLTNWEAIKMALPFAWIDWFFLTFAIDIGHTKKLVTPTQDIFLLIITQFTLVLIINYYYLKQQIYFSDIIAFVLILIAYSISLFNLVSKTFNIAIPNKVIITKENEKHVNIENKNSDLDIT
jgi:hypothetical protein